jgi:hypothetical protein
MLVGIEEGRHSSPIDQECEAATASFFDGSLAYCRLERGSYSRVLHRPSDEPESAVFEDIDEFSSLEPAPLNPEYAWNLRRNPNGSCRRIEAVPLAFL